MSQWVSKFWVEKSYDSNNREHWLDIRHNCDRSAKMPISRDIFGSQTTCVCGMKIPNELIMQYLLANENAYRGIYNGMCF